MNNLAAPVLVAVLLMAWIPSAGMFPGPFKTAQPAIGILLLIRLAHTGRRLMAGRRIGGIHRSFAGKRFIRTLGPALVFLFLLHVPGF